MIQKIIQASIWKYIICLVSVLLIFVGIYFLVRELDFQWLYDKSPELYYLCISDFYTFFFNGGWVTVVGFVWLGITLVFLIRLILKITKNMKALKKGIEILAEESPDDIELSIELEDINASLNEAKRQMDKKMREAKESEQRKNDLIVYLAHDIKTPLTSIIGYLSLLEDIKDMPLEKQEKYIHVALEKSYRLEDLINELFEIARFNSEKIILEKEWLDLNLMLEQIIDDFYPLLEETEKEVKFTSDVKCLLYGDSDKLARVFGNILKNAIHYSTDKTIFLQTLEKDDKVYVITSNKGKEIPKEKLDKIFEKFYRLDSSRTSRTGGSGLGLAIAKEIVELHNGSIWATSDEEWTKFIVELPKENKLRKN